MPDANISPQGSGKYIMNESPFGKVIHTYTTKEAISDGFLVQVDSGISQEAGIKYPVILTRSVWSRYVEVPDGLEYAQDLEGRLWDILYMFSVRARNITGDSLSFSILNLLPDIADFLPNEEPAEDMHMHRIVNLYSQIRAFDFDDPSPAIFIMIPGED